MLMLLLLAASAGPDGKTMATDDWHTLAITQVGGEAAGPVYVKVHAGDLDGDGLPDDAVIKLLCSDGRLTQSSLLLSPRDSGSGMPTGKRQHKPVTFVKEWGAASPELREMKPTYDVKAVKSARTEADGWTELALSNADGLCSAAQAQAAAIIKTKTKSNQSND